MTDLDVVFRLRSLAGVEMIDLHDHAAGYCPRSPIDVPDEMWERDVEESRYLDGFAETHSRLAGGVLVVDLRIDGSSWAQVQQRRLAVRAAYVSAPVFLVDLTLEGVTYTFRANRPDVSGLAVRNTDLARAVQTVRLSFPVQPNPALTGV